MQMMNRHIFVLFLSIFYLTAKAQEGKSAFDFLNLPISSHINALGGNNISIIEEDVSVIQHNPALLGHEMNLQLNLNCDMLPESIWQERHSPKPQENGEHGLRPSNTQDTDR